MLLYNVAIRPHIQERLHKEVDEVVSLLRCGSFSISDLFPYYFSHILTHILGQSNQFRHTCLMISQHHHVGLLICFFYANCLT